MAFEEWLSLGGNEIVNNARTLGYALTANCPMGWFKIPPCDTLAAATLAAEQYDDSERERSPWYDPVLPDVSGRFFGAYGLSIKGIEDSTRTATVTEGLGDGGVIGRVRKAPREVTVQAILAAEGQDALEYGVAWLNAALDPNACGQHGDACGTADLAYFSTCPPEWATETTYSEWSPLFTNLVTNPSMETADGTGVAGWSGLNQSGEWAADRLWSAHKPANTPDSEGQALAVAPGQTITLVATGRIVTPGGVAPRIGIRHDGGVPAESAVALPLVAGVHQVRLVTTVPAGTTANVLVMGQSDTDVWWDELLVVEGEYHGAYFDGETLSANAELNKYEWNGDPDAATSTFSERQIVATEPVPVEEYLFEVNKVRRFLHDVAAISGPHIVEEFQSGPHWAYLVEYVLVAGNPYVFGATNRLDLPPRLPVVVADIPFNLVEYPSAELSEGTIVVATNYSLNPSVEVNATGWNTASDGVGISAGITSGRTTELSSAGAASFRALFTAPGASTAPGWFAVQQEVTLPHAAIAGERYSVNMWAARSVQAGAPVFGDFEVRVLWRNAGATLGSTTVDFIEGESGGVTAKGLAPAIGATTALVRAVCFIESWNAGTIVRLYGDALAVTVP